MDKMVHLHVSMCPCTTSFAQMVSQMFICKVVLQIGARRPEVSCGAVYIKYFCSIGFLAWCLVVRCTYFCLSAFLLALCFRGSDVVGRGVAFCTSAGVTPSLLPAPLPFFLPPGLFFFAVGGGSSFSLATYMSCVYQACLLVVYFV